MEVSDWIALGVGSYAAIIATGVLIWHIIRDRPKLVVKAAGIHIPSEADSSPEELIEMEIDIINKGRQPIYIEDIGFRFSNDFEYSFSPSVLNLEQCLQSGTKCTASINITNLKNRKYGRVVKFAFVRDSTGKVYKIRIPKYIKNYINRQLPEEQFWDAL